MSTKKKLILGLLSLAVIGGGAFAYARTTDEIPTVRTELTQEGLDQLNAEDESPITEKEQGEDQGSTAETPQAPTQNSAPNKQTVSVSISQASYDNEVVRVKAFADTLENGNCTLIFTKSGQSTLTYFGNTEMQPSYTQCNPFDVPHTEFPVHGTWQLRVIFESPTYKGEATGEVSI